MQDNTLLDAVERYLRGEMTPDEKSSFEHLRNTNPDVERLVVEHSDFVEQFVRHGETTRIKTRLNEVHEIYMSYVKRNQAPPKQFSDLNERSYSEIYPGAFNAIKDGKYVVVWGVSEKDSSTVLAYPKDAPTQGGLVLMADGKVKTMTADQLQATFKK